MKSGIIITLLCLFIVSLAYGQGLIDTLTWRTLDNPYGTFQFSTGDSAAMWFLPSSSCSLRAIRIRFVNFAGNILIDVFSSRYDGHITSTDSTDVLGWIGTHQDSQWQPGYILGHSPLGERLWGPFPLTVTHADDYSWVEVNTSLVREADLGEEPFCVGLNLYPLEDLARAISMEGEGTIPYHYFKYYNSCCGPDGIHNGWFLRSWSLWVEVIVSYYGNIPPEIEDMDILSDTYYSGPFTVTARIEDSNTTRPAQAGVESAILHWDIFGYSGTTEMTGPSGDHCFTAEIPAIGIGDRVEYYITATDSNRAESMNTHRYFTRLVPEHPQADILLLDYGYGFGLSEYWPAVIESLGYTYEYWSAQAHNGIDASVVGWGWSMVIPWGMYRPNVPIIPSREYEGQLWSDFLQTGTVDHPVNLLHTSIMYFGLNHDYNPQYGPGDFAYDFFGLDSATTDHRDGERTFYGVAGDPVSGEFTETPFRHTGDLDWFHQYWFYYTFANERGADLFYTQDGKSSGTRCDGGIFKTVFLPWEIEYMLESSENDTFPSADFLRLAENILEWFGTEKERTGVAEIQTTVAPEHFVLEQNYPNPFNAKTDIRYQIPDGRYPIQTTLKIYNVLGQEVRTLIDDVPQPGCFTSTWDGKDRFGRSAASGIYFYRLSICGGGWSETKRMVLLR